MHRIPGSRPIPALAVCAALLLAASCRQPERVPEPGPGPSEIPAAVPTTLPEPPRGTRLAATTRIAESDVASSSRGAWTWRVAKRPDTPARGSESALRGFGGGGGGADKPGEAAKEPEALDVAEDGLKREGATPPAGAAPAPSAKPATAGLRLEDASAGGGGDGRDEVEHRKLRRVGSGDAPGGEVAAPVQALRAGSTDDNADYAGFLAFLENWTGGGKKDGRFQSIDVRDRRFVQVRDAAGRPVPAARVVVLDEAADRVVADASTLGDGRAIVFPRLASPDGSLPPTLVADVRFGGAARRVRFDTAGTDELVVTLDVQAPPPDPVPLDVTFLIDTTGSMGDEIASIQKCLLDVTARVRSLGRESDLRYATVLYRDVGDEYLTATHPFTPDVDALDAALRDVRAGGGGDGPESLNQGLAEAVDGLAWREGAAKVVFLIADAPPHMDYAGDTPYGVTLRRAASLGIRIHTVAASGLDSVGTVVFRQIAQFTRGQFVFVEYGVPGSGTDAKGHGVSGATKSDNLDDLIFERIRDEVARWGR